MHKSGAVLLIGLVLLGSSFLFLVRLDSLPFQDDEALYAQVVREGFASHEFVALTYLHQPYFNKPPLLFWLMAGARELVPHDVQESARLPSAIAGILLVGAIMLFVYEATGSVTAAAGGGLVLATTASLLLLARAARFDTLASLWIVLATYAALRALQDKRWYIGAGVALGLLVMTKGPSLAVFALIAAGAGTLAYYPARAYGARISELIQTPYLWVGAAISLVIALPWHIYESLKFGTTFWQVYIIGQVITRVQQNLLGQALTNSQYISYLAKYAAPWSTICLLTLLLVPFIWQRIPPKRRAFFIASVAGLISVVVICFLTSSKSYRYLVPLYPFMAAVISILLFEASQQVSRRVRRYAFGIGMLILASATAWAVYVGFSLDPTYPYYTNDPHFLADEKQVGQILRTKHLPSFYSYDSIRIRPVIYYSGITNTYFLPVAGRFANFYTVFLTGELAAFEQEHPEEPVTSVYHGAFVDLAIVSNAAPACPYTPKPQP